MMTFEKLGKSGIAGIISVDDISVEEFAHTKKTLTDYVQQLLLGNRYFTGKLEINFKNGQLMDINKTERTKF